MKLDAKIALLGEQAVDLQQRIAALAAPRGDKARRLIEYELTKIRLQLRDLKEIRRSHRRAAGKRLIPYAGYEQGAKR